MTSNTENREELQLLGNGVWVSSWTCEEVVSVCGCIIQGPTRRQKTHCILNRESLIWISIIYTWGLKFIGDLLIRENSEEYRMDVRCNHWVITCRLRGSTHRRVLSYRCPDLSSRRQWKGHGLSSLSAREIWGTILQNLLEIDPWWFWSRLSTRRCYLRTHSKATWDFAELSWAAGYPELQAPGAAMPFTEGAEGWRSCPAGACPEKYPRRFFPSEFL